MRIAMLSDDTNPPAPQRGIDADDRHHQLTALCSALVAAGHDVTVYTRRDESRRPRVQRAAGGYEIVRVSAGPATPDPEDDLVSHTGEFVRHLEREFRDRPPDVLHSDSWPTGIAAVLVGGRLGIPVTYSYQSDGTPQHRRDAGATRRAGVERLIGRGATRIIATCDDDVIELSRLGLSRQHVSVVPRGVDTELFTPEGPSARKRLPYRVVSVGPLRPHSGFGDLIVALATVPDTELVIVGGPERGKVASDLEVRRLVAFAERLGVAGRVRFAGGVRRERMPALLRSADLVACAPWSVPSGMAPLEAMACAVPVLGTRVGALTDLVVEGVTGVLVPARRPGALRAGMVALLADPVKRSFLGSTGRDRAESRYPWRRIAADVARVYEHCVAPPQAERRGSGRVAPVVSTVAVAE